VFNAINIFYEKMMVRFGYKGSPGRLEAPEKDFLVLHIGAHFLSD
jgi:hypothetical protein